MKHVLVEWEDASVVDFDTWVTREGAKAPEAVVFKTIGWLVELTKEAVVITDSFDKSLMGPRTRIPCGMVRQLLVFDESAGVPLAIPRRRKKTT